MVSRLKILVASRSDTAADAVAGKLCDRGRFHVTTRVISNGHTDPLHDVHPRPDLLILHYVPGYGELEYLATLSPGQRTRLLVFGPAGDANAMRLAMRAGASDYLPEPLTEEDLLLSIEHIGEELAEDTGAEGDLITVMNCKGGSGASFIASNLGCALAQEEARRTALIDLDLQFGSLARYLDVTPGRGLMEALDSINEMDQVSAAAFVTPHASGLKLLAAPSDELSRQRHVPPEQIDAMLQIFLQHHHHVVADIPQRLDALGTTVLERSDRILLVLQQSLAHINNAAKLLHIIGNEFGIDRERVEIVINRFSKNSVIELEDIRKTLRVENVHMIPNHYKLVSESIDTGAPVVRSAKGSAVARALYDLARESSGAGPDKAKSKGFLGRALPNLLGAN